MLFHIQENILCLQGFFLELFFGQLELGREVTTMHTFTEFPIQWKKQFPLIASTGFVFFLIISLFTTSVSGDPVTTRNSEWNETFYDILDDKTYEKFPPFSQRINFDKVDYPLLHAAMNFETNRRRIRNGLKPLPWHIGLETAAYHHSRMMAQKRFFSHTSPVPGRRTPTDRAKLAGIQNPKIAENIATNFGVEYTGGRRVFFKGKGQFSYDNKTLIPNHTYLGLAKALITQWMNSPGHRANILNKNGISMGNGVYFFVDPRFNSMVKCQATQKFQWFREIKWKKGKDPFAPKWIEN